VWPRIGLALEIYDGCPHMANTPVVAETYHIHSQLSPAAFSILSSLALDPGSLVLGKNKAKVFASYLRQCRVKFFSLSRSCSCFFSIPVLWVDIYTIYIAIAL